MALHANADAPVELIDMEILGNTMVSMDGVVDSFSELTVVVFACFTIKVACHLPGPRSNMLLKSEVNLTVILFDLVKLGGGLSYPWSFN